MANWVGYAVSVNCGEPLGCYQGTILNADGTTITLTKAFRNGFPYPKSQVTLNAADIKELKIIEARAEPAEQTHSTVAVAKSNKKAARATVCENLQANPSSSGNQAGGSGGGGGGGGGGRAARSKPIDIQPSRSGKSNNHAGSYGQSGSTPKGRGGGADKQRRRNEACFGDAADPALDRDFDFEGNLALFDKRALWEQINNQKPDLAHGKFRHDENVLGGGGGGGGPRRAIVVPDELRGPLDYVSDDGCVVPAAAAGARRRLWAALARAGQAHTARVLLARAGADVCVRLVGGGRRLEPRNAHQAPAAAVLAGHHDAGAAGLLAARLLASHGARVAVYVHPPLAGASAAVAQEVAALALADVAVCGRLALLPRADLLLLALHDPALDEPAAHYAAVAEWARAARAGAVALEPAPGWDVPCRASVFALLPGAGAALGRVFLADVAPPLRVFQELRVHYRPPFGAHSLLALHPADD
ncbi:enhancer of mRNA-decapping protein 3 [Pectinophora gossypiella]|uniref:enhancer of mRNA-decapping protein 3 n=1 Tax=Pectinophora gossypiella TaxID=13191 RepID=UPI00214F5E69|nr:enhancer of mRNA-decapping protein 3 [Pectinophora gossypiella]